MRRVILLADASEAIRKVAELTFGDSPIRVETVTTGEDAWRRFAELGPDLVIADAVMPAPDGYEICRRVKASGRPVPVLLLSGRFDAFDAARAERCEADGHLRKPFDADALRRSVDRLWRRRSPGVATDPSSWPPATLDAIADAVVDRIGARALRQAVADVLPDVAERVVRERIRELERLDETENEPDDRAGPAARGA